MSRVTLEAGIASQIPTLMGQFSGLKTKAMDFASSINGQAQQAAAMSRKQAAEAITDARAEGASINQLSNQFNEGITRAVALSQQLRSSATNLGSGVAGATTAAVSANSAALSGPAQAVFNDALGRIKEVMASIEHMDKKTEMAATRAQASVIFARETIGLQQERNALIKQEEIISQAIFESSKGIRAERQAEAKIRQTTAGFAGANPEFAKNQANLAALRDKLSVVRSSLIAQFESGKLVDNERAAYVNIINLVKTRIADEERIEGSLLEQAAHYTTQKIKLEIVNAALKEGEAQIRRMKDAALGVDDALQIIATREKQALTQLSFLTDEFREQQMEVEKLISMGKRMEAAQKILVMDSALLTDEMRLTVEQFIKAEAATQVIAAQMANAAAQTERLRVAAVAYDEALQLSRMHEQESTNQLRFRTEEFRIQEAEVEKLIGQGKRMEAAEKLLLMDTNLMTEEMREQVMLFSQAEAETQFMAMVLKRATEETKSLNSMAKSFDMIIDDAAHSVERTAKATNLGKNEMMQWEKNAARFAATMERAGAAAARTAGRGANFRSGQETSFARQPFIGSLGRLPQQKESARLEIMVQGLQRNGVQLKTANGVVTRQLTEEEARLMIARTASTTALERYNREYQISNGLMRRNRAQLINNSIGMFVLSITITQTVAALEQMIKSWADADENAKAFGIRVEDIAKFLNEMNQVLRFAIGPIQVYTAIMQLAAQANRAFFLSAIPMLALFGGMGILMKAFTAESKKMRAVFGGIGIVIGGVATAVSAYNLATEISTIRATNAALAVTSLTLATVGENVAVSGTTTAKAAGIIVSNGYVSSQTAETVSTGSLTAAKTSLFTVEAGLLSLKTFGLGAVLVLSILSLMASVYATVRAFQSFDTQPGEYKTVGSTGPAMVHKGEVISTPAAMGNHGSFGSGGGGGQTVEINYHIAGNLDTAVPRAMVKRLKSGQIGGGFGF